MWQRFTEMARRVVFFAQEEAGRLGENYVSTEHLLLGIVRDGEQNSVNVACRVLQRLGVSTVVVRDKMLEHIAHGDGRLGQDMQLTPRAKRVIDLAYNEARILDNNYIGTEHILLGIIGEGEGLAGRVLTELGVTLEATRAEVATMQSEAAAEKEQANSQPGPSPKPSRETQPEQKIDGARLESRVRALLTELRRTSPLLFLLESGGDLAQEVTKRLQGGDTGKATPGDLGIAQAKNGRTVVEIASDAETFRALVAAYQTKDAHGYRQLTHGDQSLFLVPNDTPLKRLVFPHSRSSAPTLGGIWVRVLGGEYEGYAGWMFADNFERTGPDDSPFPPQDTTEDDQEVL